VDPEYIIGGGASIIAPLGSMPVGTILSKSELH